MHTVARKETIFSLCQKYNVTQQELQAANPGLAGILQAGSTVKIPVKKVSPKTQEKQHNEKELAVIA